jgi:hypothetical protein
MVGRLPESWIAPDHILDLRARVRLRHSLVAQRGEWQQRIQATATPGHSPHADITSRRARGCRSHLHRQRVAGLLTARRALRRTISALAVACPE